MSDAVCHGSGEIGNGSGDVAHQSDGIAYSIMKWLTGQGMWLTD